MKEYEKEKDVLIGLKMAEKDKDKVCDWSSEEEVGIMKQEARKEYRKRELDAIVKSRVCPCCRRRIWLDCFWVIIERMAFCRSCYHSQKMGMVEDVTGSFIVETIIRFKISGWKIKALRSKVGIGSLAFAERMGWSKTYLYKIERDEVVTLSSEIVEKLIFIFEDLGVSITDCGS